MKHYTAPEIGTVATVHKQSVWRVCLHWSPDEREIRSYATREAAENVARKHAALISR